MNEPIFSEFSNDFNLAFAAFVDVPKPDETFVSSLEQRLMYRQKAVTLQLPQTDIKQTLVRRWHVALLAVVLGLLIAFVSIGPQRVWAALQALTVYIQGVGFVDGNNLLALEDPVRLTRGNQAIQIDQLVASRTGTTLVFHTYGFSPEQAADLSRRITLRMADGEEWAPQSRAVDITERAGEYRVTYQFEPLPADVRNVTFVWRQTVSAKGEEIATWEIPLSLSPPSDPDVANLLPFSYTPTGAQTEQRAVNLRVDQVSHSPNETAVKIWYTFPESYGTVYLLAPALTDNQGNRYQESSLQAIFTDNGQAATVLTTPAATPQVYHGFNQTLEFPAVAPTTDTLTLHVERIQFRARPQATFELELGNAPRLGDTWPIGQTIEVADTTVRVLDARLARLDLLPPDSDIDNPVGLLLDLKPESGSGLEIKQVWLQIGLERAMGQNRETGAWTPAWEASDIPHGKIVLELNMIEGDLTGPWEITWHKDE